MNELQITIGMPLYNVEIKDLRRAVESIKKQCLNSYEILFVIDGKENNKNIIENDFFYNIPNSRVIIQNHQGEGAARNKIISLAKGKYLLFLDSDDYFVPKSIKYLIKKAEIEKVDLLLSNHRRIYSKKEIDIIHFKKDEYISSNMSHKLFEDILSIGSDQGTVWGKVFNLNYIRSNNIRFDESLTNGVDQEFMVRFLMRKPNAYAVDTISYNYVCNNNSLVHKFDNKYLNKVNATIKKISEDLKDYNLAPSILTKYCYDRLILTITNYCCNQSVKEYKERKRLFRKIINTPYFKAILEKKIIIIDPIRYLIIVLAKYNKFLFIDLIMKIRLYFR